MSNWSYDPDFEDVQANAKFKVTFLLAINRVMQK